MRHRDRERVPERTSSGILPFIFVLIIIIVVPVGIFLANPLKGISLPEPERPTPSFTLEPPATLEPTATPTLSAPVIATQRATQYPWSLFLPMIAQ